MPSSWPHRRAIFRRWKNSLHPTLFPPPMEGGALHIARLPVTGRDRVANYFASVGPFFGNGVTIEWIETKRACVTEWSSHSPGDHRSVSRRYLQSLVND